MILKRFNFQVHPIHQYKNVDSDSGGKGNVILYIGLGMMAVGLVITFVGLGDKGFKTLELKLIGPSLVGCGMFFALLRILYCTVPACGKTCCGRNEETEKLLNEELLVEEQSVNRNVVSSPGNNKHDSAVIRPRVTNQKHIPEVKDSLRPRLKAARQKTKNGLNGGPCYRSRQDVVENFSFSSSTFNFQNRGPETGGSTKDLHTGEITLNSVRLSGYQDKNPGHK